MKEGRKEKRRVLYRIVTEDYPHEWVHWGGTYRNFTIHWFCLKREEPLVVPEIMVQLDNEHESEQNRLMAKDWVNELFTYDEAQQLLECSFSSERVFLLADHFPPNQRQIY